MNRSERRALDRGLQRLLSKNGDQCTVCHMDFLHNSKTFYGQSAGAPAIVGLCCRSKLSVEIGSGLYLRHDYDMFTRATGARKDSPPAEELEATIERVQQGLAEVDAMAAAAQAKGGMAGTPSRVSVRNSAWKADDAAWFRAHPDRAHRLRPLVEGERDSFPNGLRAVATPGHELQVVVRQVEPGRRIRVPFARNLETPIPDAEPIIHALFDAVSKRRAAPVISVEEVAGLADRYHLGTGPPIN